MRQEVQQPLHSHNDKIILLTGSPLISISIFPPLGFDCRSFNYLHEIFSVPRFSLFITSAGFRVSITIIPASAAGVVGVGISDEGLEQLESIMKFNARILISAIESINQISCARDIDAKLS